MALTKADMASIAAMIAAASKQETAPAPETKTPQARKQNRAANTAKQTAAKPVNTKVHGANAECSACGIPFARKDGSKTRRCRTCIDDSQATYSRLNRILDGFDIPTSDDDGNRLSQQDRVLSLLQRDYEGLPE